MSECTICTLYWNDPWMIIYLWSSSTRIPSVEHYSFHCLVTLRGIGLNSVQQTKLETRVWVLLYYCLCAEQPEQLVLLNMVCSFRPAMVIIRMSALDIYEQGHVGIECLQRDPFHSSRFLVTWPPGPCLYEFNVGSKRHKHSKYRQRPSRTGRSDAW